MELDSQSVEEWLASADTSEKQSTVASATEDGSGWRPEGDHAGHKRRRLPRNEHSHTSAESSSASSILPLSSAVRVSVSTANGSLAASRQAEFSAGHQQEAMITVGRMMELDKLTAKRLAQVRSHVRKMPLPVTERDLEKVRGFHKLIEQDISGGLFEIDTVVNKHYLTPLLAMQLLELHDALENHRVQLSVFVEELQALAAHGASPPPLARLARLCIVSQPFYLNAKQNRSIEEPFVTHLALGARVRIAHAHRVHTQIVDDGGGDDNSRKGALSSASLRNADAPLRERGDAFHTATIDRLCFTQGSRARVVRLQFTVDVELVFDIGEEHAAKVSLASEMSHGVVIKTNEGQWGECEGRLLRDALWPGHGNDDEQGDGVNGDASNTDGGKKAASARATAASSRPRRAARSTARAAAIEVDDDDDDGGGGVGDAHKSEASVSWVRYCNFLQIAYIRCTRQPMKRPMRPLTSQEFEYLRALLLPSMQARGDTIAPARDWSRLWGWFGPVLQRVRMQRHVLEMFARGAIVGFLGRQHAESLLHNIQVPGAFVLRFSERVAGQIAISYLVARRDQTLSARHYLVKPTDTTGSKKTLPDFLRNYDDELQYVVCATRERTGETLHSRYYALTAKDTCLGDLYTRREPTDDGSGSYDEDITSNP